MSLCPVGSRAVTVRFPRVSGDEPLNIMDAAEDVKFSPRERG